MAGSYRIRNLRKDYTPQDEGQRAAIDVDTLDIGLGGIIAIVGGSGSGKTTFLNLISGLEEPDVSEASAIDLRLPGQTEVLHLAQATGSGTSTDAFPHDKVSYIFQEGYLLSQASIAINLAMTRRAAGLRADMASLDKLLELAQLHENGDSGGSRRKSLGDRALTLSGGQQQRINIARALGREPQLLFADELSSSLDPRKAQQVLTELKKWIWQDASPDGHSRQSLQRTMLWVTHDYELACQFSDALIVLHEGQVARNCQQPLELHRCTPAVQASDLVAWVHQGEIPVALLPSSEPEKTEDQSDTLPAAKIDHAQTITPIQAVLGNIGSGISLSWMEAYPQPRSSHSVFAGWMKQLARPVFGFSHWVRALQLAAVLSLIMIITYGRNEVIAYFDAQLADPSLRHVIVQQNTRELQKSIIDDRSLSELSKTIAGLSLPENPAGPHAQRVAFGRFTESVDVYPEGMDQTNPGYIAEITIGILDSREPVYNTLQVRAIDPASPGCDNNRLASPKELIPYADELALIVSESYIADVKKIFDVDLCTNPVLDLWDAGAPRNFRVVGFVPNPPADGYDYFDAMMQVDVWRNWVSQVGKLQIESFARAAVYFTQSNHKAVIGELHNRSFAFDREIISKFERLIGTAAQLRNTFLVITWLTLVVAATVAAGLIWSYLVQNSKSIAVLRAHSAWVWPLAAAIPFQLVLTFSYSLAYIGITIGVWNWCVSLPSLVDSATRLTGGAWVPARLDWSIVASTLPWVVGSLVVMLLVGWACMGVWRITHYRLAHELRQAY